MKPSNMIILVLAVALPLRAVWADPASSILTNYTEGGQRQLDFRLGASTEKNQPTDSGGVVGLGYGVTDQWFSEVYVAAAKSGSNGADFDSASWQNTLLLTGGDAPVTFSLYNEIEYEHDRTQGEQITFGTLMETEFGLTTVNLNLLLQRNYRADFSNPMLLGYQWQVRKHGAAAVDVGLQGFGQFGRWNQFAPRDQQSHQVGPALFGKFNLGDQSVVNINAAILFDVLDDQHSTTFRLQAVWGF